MKMSYEKNGFIELLKSGDYIVSSTPFGCREGYSKIVVRKKKGKSVNVVPIPDEYSRCKADAEIEKLKRDIKESL